MIFNKKVLIYGFFVFAIFILCLISFIPEETHMQIRDTNNYVIFKKSFDGYKITKICIENNLFILVQDDDECFEMFKLSDSCTKETE